MIYNLFDTKRQISQWKAREELLTQWIENHTALHSQFEEKYRELMNAKQKLRQLRQRHYRKYNKTSGLEEQNISNI